MTNKRSDSNRILGGVRLNDEEEDDDKENVGIGGGGETSLELPNGSLLNETLLKIAVCSFLPLFAGPSRLAI